MTMQIEHLVKPFSVMSEEEKLALIRQVRHNRFEVKATMAKTKAKAVAKKSSARKGSAQKRMVLEYLKSLSPEEQAAALAKLTK